MRLARSSVARLQQTGPEGISGRILHMGTAAEKFPAGGPPHRGVACAGFVVASILLLLPITVTHSGTDAQCQPVVESRADQEWLRVRPHRDAFLQCTLGREDLAQLVREFLLRPEQAAIRYRSLFLGRLVEYPWLSRHLADRALEDANWDPVRGSPRAGSVNEFARGILSTPSALALLQSAFEGTGYTVTGVSVEKILVAPANSVAWLENSRADLVPYDAMTHVTIGRE